MSELVAMEKRKEGRERQRARKKGGRRRGGKEKRRKTKKKREKKFLPWPSSSRSHCFSGRTIASSTS
jgi:hypothetical protein